MLSIMFQVVVRDMRLGRDIIEDGAAEAAVATLPSSLF
jgi:hypothetical protein